MEASRRVGQLETLLQLEGPEATPQEMKRVRVVSETYSDSETQRESF